MRKIYFSLILIFLFSCHEETLPKPRAFLNLEFDKPIYQQLKLFRPYSFEVSKRVEIINEPNNWLKIDYPFIGASVDITYRGIENNLRELIMESEKLVFKHTLKAEKISSNDYINNDKKVFGTIYEITGNAASHIQFHLTDSSKHFIKGGLYFKTKPNYDSLLPAVAYIKNDILYLIETFKWKN
tara:strand:- start:608 stop:1159 length:552 start_codon:yes stop_codon:yes gene_type:complete